MNNVRRNLMKYVPVGLLALLAPKIEAKVVDQPNQVVVPLGDMANSNYSRVSYWQAVRNDYELKHDPFMGNDVDEQEQFMPISGVMINRFGRITSLVIELPK